MFCSLCRAVGSLVLLLPTPAFPAVAQEPAPAVFLDSQSGAVEIAGDKPTINIHAEVKNTRAVRVDSVDLGVLFAESVADLEGVNPSKAYGRVPAVGHRVGVLRRRIAVDLPPLGRTQLRLVLPLSPAVPQPHAFFVHVLGYALADFNADLPFGLLETSSPIDESALVTTLALNGSREQRASARARWGNNSVLLNEFEVELSRPIPDRPTERDTFRRVLAVRALGVLGGKAAVHVLKRVSNDPLLSRFDEPFQVLRIARLVGSELETPLAFAVPPEAHVMGDIFRIAIDDAETLGSLAASVHPAGTAQVSKSLSAPNASTEHFFVALGTSLVCAVCLFVRGLRRRRSRSRQAPVTPHSPPISDRSPPA